MVSLLEMALLLLCIAVSGLHVLQQVLDYLLAISASNHPVVSVAAGAVTPFALCIAYFTGITLVLLRIAPAPPALASPVALRHFFAVAAMACALLLLLAITPLLSWP